MVEPPVMVGLGLGSAAIHDVTYDSLFTALELSVLNPWLVRPARESVCTVTYCEHHVKRVLTRSDGKVHVARECCSSQVSPAMIMFLRRHRVSMSLCCFFLRGLDPLVRARKTDASH